ncbi:hexokinase, putative, partial [Leishmania donovani]
MCMCMCKCVCVCVCVTARVYVYMCMHIYIRISLSMSRSRSVSANVRARGERGGRLSFHVLSLVRPRPPHPLLTEHRGDQNEIWPSPPVSSACKNTYTHTLLPDMDRAATIKRTRARVHKSGVVCTDEEEEAQYTSPPLALYALPRPLIFGSRTKSSMYGRMMRHAAAYLATPALPSSPSHPLLFVSFPHSFASTRYDGHHRCPPPFLTLPPARPTHPTNTRTRWSTARLHLPPPLEVSYNSQTPFTPLLSSSAHTPPLPTTLHSVTMATRVNNLLSHIAIRDSDSEEMRYIKQRLALASLATQFTMSSEKMKQLTMYMIHE